MGTTSTAYAHAKRSGFTTAFGGGVFEAWSGPAPGDSDNAQSGIFLGYFSLNAGVWAEGSPANGLVFDVATDLLAAKPSGAAWQMNPTVAGTIGHVRLRGVAPDNNLADGTQVLQRMHFAVGTAAGQVVVDQTAVTPGIPVNILAFQLAFPREIS